MISKTRSEPARAAWMELYRLRNLAQGVDEVAGVADEGDNRAHGNQASQCQPAAQPGQDDDKEIAKLVGERHQQQGIGVGADAPDDKLPGCACGTSRWRFRYAGRP